MALDIPSASALGFAAEAVRTQNQLNARAVRSGASLSSSSRISTTSLELPANLGQSRAEATIVLSSTDAAVAVGTAIASGNLIVSALKALRGAFNVATSDGLTSSFFGLELDGASLSSAPEVGTRISRITIQAGSQRLIDAINDLVAEADLGGANLISSNSPRFTLITSQYGGRITVSPQPLDAAGLGIDDLSVLTRAEAELALAKIENAIHIAENRLGNLTGFQDNLGLASRISQTFTDLLNAQANNVLPAGSLVNQIA